MIITFLLGFAAGALAPIGEDRLMELLKGISFFEPAPDEAELRTLALVLALIIAAILSNSLGNGSPVVLAIGAFVGVVMPRIMERVQKKKAPDYDTDSNGDDAA